MAFNMNAIDSKIEESKNKPVSDNNGYAEVISKLKANDKVRATTVHVVKCEYDVTMKGDYYTLYLDRYVTRGIKDKQIPLADGSVKTTYKFEPDTKYFINKAVFARYFGASEFPRMAFNALNDPMSFCVFMNNFDENDVPQGRDIELVQWFVDEGTTNVDPITKKEFITKSDNIQDFIGNIDIDTATKNIAKENRAKTIADAKARLALYLQ